MAMTLIRGAGMGNLVRKRGAIPALPGGPPTTFNFEVTTTAAAQTYSWGVGGTSITATTDWGDGGAVENHAASGTYVHTYANAGVYTVKVNVTGGTNAAVTFRPGTDRTRLTKILGIFPAWSNVTSLLNCFSGCSGLTGSIPVDLLRYVTSVTNLSSFFSACSGLTGSIPVDFLRYVTSATNLSGCFNGCSGLTGSIPVDHFRYATSATSISNHFASCSGLTGSLPTDLLRYVTSVTVATGLFSGCFNLTGMVPVDFLRYCLNINNFTSMFSGCSRLELQVDIFGPNAAATRFLNKSPIFTSMFNAMGTNPSVADGTAPDMWNFSYGTGTPTTTNAFTGNANSLTNWAVIPIAWGGPL